MFVLVLAAEADETRQAITFLILCLVGIAAVLLALTAWYWHFTSPRRRAEALLSELGHFEPGPDLADESPQSTVSAGAALMADAMASVAGAGSGGAAGSSGSGGSTVSRGSDPPLGPPPPAPRNDAAPEDAALEDDAAPEDAALEDDAAPEDAELAGSDGAGSIAARGPHRWDFPDRRSAARRRERPAGPPRTEPPGPAATPNHDAQRSPGAPSGRTRPRIGPARRRGQVGAADQERHGDELAAARRRRDRRQEALSDDDWASVMQSVFDRLDR